MKQGCFYFLTLRIHLLFSSEPIHKLIGYLLENKFAWQYAFACRSISRFSYCWTRGRRHRAQYDWIEPDRAKNMNPERIRKIVRSGVPLFVTNTGSFKLAEL
jgi:hypothetical protein